MGSTTRRLPLLIGGSLAIVFVVFVTIKSYQSFQKKADYSLLVSLSIAFQNYHDDYNRFPLIKKYDTDNCICSWRIQLLPYLLRQIPQTDQTNELKRLVGKLHAEESTTSCNCLMDYPPPTFFQSRKDTRKSAFVAVLNHRGDVWDAKAIGEYQALKQQFGNPIIVIYAPNIKIDWTSSNEIFINDSRIFFQKSNIDVTSDHLKDGLALRLDGVIEPIPSVSSQKALIEYLSSNQSLIH